MIASLVVKLESFLQFLLSLKVRYSQNIDCILAKEDRFVKVAKVQHVVFVFSFDEFTTKKTIRSLFNEEVNNLQVEIDSFDLNDSIGSLSKAALLDEFIQMWFEPMFLDVFHFDYDTRKVATKGVDNGKTIIVVERSRVAIKFFCKHF